MRAYVILVVEKGGETSLSQEAYGIHDLRVVDPHGKRRFWGVSQKYFDSGKVKVNVFPVDAEEKPESTQRDNKMCDEYVDYFDSY